MRRIGRKNPSPAAKSAVKTHGAPKVGDHLAMGAAKRARHDAGVSVLNKIFSFNPSSVTPPPKRTRPEAKRRKRKIAHESRRRNRL